MRSRLTLWLVLVWITAACASAPGVSAPGGIHAVDGYWIGAELECDPASEKEPWSAPCSAVVADAERNLLATTPGAVVVDGVMAAVPADFTAPDGRPIQGRVAVGIMTRTFVVLDLFGGSRRVVGQVCYIAHNEHGIRTEPTGCLLDSMEEWRVNP